MFLNQLENKNKRLFLKVCVLASLSDGVFAKEEREMITAYCKEMNVPEEVPDCPETMNDLLEEIAQNTSEKEKKIIVLEILGLLRSDGIFEDMEKTFVDTLAEKLDVPYYVFDQINSLLKVYTAVYQELYSTICE